MMNRPFEPRIQRLKKSRRRYPKGIYTGQKLVKYNCGIYSITAGKLQSFHIETIRKTIVNFFSRQQKPFIRCVPNWSYTAKPFDIKRGRGKGAVQGWYQYIRMNKIMFEFTCDDVNIAKDIASIVNSKLPMKVKLITKDQEESGFVIGDWQSNIKSLKKKTI